MARIDLEPNGDFERAIQPTLNRFRLNAEMGVNTVLSPDSAQATAEAFEMLVRIVDADRAAAHGVRVLLRFLGGLVGLIAALVLLANL